MMSRCFLIFFVCVFGPLFLWVLTSTAMSKDCSPIDEKPVKVEAWMSKQYEKSLRQIRNEFSAMGNTRVTLWVYPAKNPSKIVAIGSCVPAYIGRHILRKAIEYSGGVSSLVHQGFFSANWIGVGASLFAESSFRPVTKDQLMTLMDTSLDTQKFQETYRQLTMQQKKIKAFGLMLRNPKLLENP
jgi:hypothetical protein